MFKMMNALLMSAGLAVAGAAAAQSTAPTNATPPLLSKDAYALAKTNADAQYKVDKVACKALSGNANDICKAQASGKQAVARADAEAAFKGTPKARENARIAHAQASYAVAIEKCDDLAGNPKDVCVKEAKARLVTDKANAKVDRVVADTREVATAKRAEARDEAAEAVRDADYKVTVEKCESLAGPTKDACVGQAKVQFGKT